jgi:SAM-dependent methyltransferase
VSTSAETFQISLEQADSYEARYVPAIFGEWASALVDAASLRPGQAVLDVACGTGIVARTAASRVAPGGIVTGVDINEGMLAVARRVRPDLDWRRGDAGALPFAADSFDVVLCQAALMFLPDATEALRQMARVSKGGGVVGVQVFASLHDQPAYGPWVELIAKHAGPAALDMLSTYWVHGDIARLKARLADAGLNLSAVHTRQGTAKWASIEEFVDTEITSTPLVERITPAVQARIVEDSGPLLDRFISQGELHIPLVGHLIIAGKP